MTSIPARTRISAPLLLLALALLLAGCGGGGGGTGGATPVSGGGVAAIIGGIVVQSTAAPSLAPDAEPSEAPAAEPPGRAPSVAPAAGVRVRLMDGTVPIAETVTDSSGFYRFDLDASLVDKNLKVVVEFGSAATSVSATVVPVQNRTVFTRLEVNSASKALVDVKQVESSEFGINASLPTIYSTSFNATSGSGRGTIRGLVDADAAQVQVQLDGVNVGKSASATAPWFTTTGSAGSGKYFYEIRNVEAGTRTVRATSGGRIIERRNVRVVSDLATPDVDLLFNEVSPLLAIEKIAGDGQTGNVGTPAANPLVVRVAENGLPKQGAVVVFAVTAGVATPDPLVAATGVDGRAECRLTFGATASFVTVRASLQDFPGTAVTFTLQSINPQSAAGNPEATVVAAEASNRRITVQWNEDVQSGPASLAANYQISVNNAAFTPLPGDAALAYAPATRQTTITLPAGTPFPAGQTVRLKISNVVDAGGTPTNPAEGYTTNLYTITDTIAPTAAVSAALAASGSIHVDFSEPVRNAELVAAYSVARDGGISFTPLAAPATVEYNPATAKARISLNGLFNLAAGDAVVVKITAVEDLAGNKLGGAAGVYLTPAVTATLGDTTPPTASIASADDLSQQVVIQFSEPVGAANAGQIGNYVIRHQGVPKQLNLNYAKVTYDAANARATLTFEPTLPLVAGDVIAVSIANLFDLAGNPSVPSPFVTLDFPVEDKRPPTATVEYASDSQEICLKFSEPLKGAGLVNFELSEDEVNWTRLNSITATVRVNVNTTPGYRVYLNVVSGYPLVGGQPVWVRMSQLYDLSGLGVVPVNAYVVGPATIAEQVTVIPSATIQAADDSNQKIILKLNKRCANAADKTLYWVSRDDGNNYRSIGQFATGKVTYDDAALTVAIEDSAFRFYPGDKIRVMINGLVDLVGRTTNPAAGYIVGPYTAQDKTLPVASVLSANAESQIVVIQFDERISGLSGAAGIALAKNGGSFGTITPYVTYDDATRRATLELNRLPDGANRGGNPYFTTADTVAFRFSAIADLAGNAASLAQPVVTPFVGAAATSSPVATIHAATDGDQKIVLAFTKTIAFTGGAANFAVSRDNGATFTPLTSVSTAIYEAATNRINLIVRDPVNFVSGDQIKVRMDGIVDSQGIPTYPATGYVTAAATAVDTTAPRAWIDAATDGNQRIRLAFSEPVKNANAIANYALSRDNGATYLPLSAASTVSYVASPPNYIATITVEPALAFAAGQSIRLAMSRIVDALDNPTIPATNYVTDAVTATDTTPPSASILLAEDGVNRIVVEFSEPVDKAKVETPGNWYVNTNGVSLEPAAFSRLSLSSVVYDATSRQAAIVVNDKDAAGFDIKLTAGRTLYLQITAVTDLVGNVGVTSGLPGNPYRLQVGPYTIRDGKAPTASIYSTSVLDQSIFVQFSEPVTGADSASNFAVSIDNGATFTPYVNAIQYDAATRRTRLVMDGNMPAFTVNNRIIVRMSNIRDLAGNFTVPAVNYATASVYAYAGTTRPEAQIWKATDSDRKIYFKFNVPVTGATDAANFAWSKNNGTSYYGSGNIDSIVADPSTTYGYVLSVTGAVSFQYGDVMRLRMSNILSTYGETTVPATNYVTPAFAAQDTTPPTATIVASSDADQTLTVQYSEPVSSGAALITNYKISKDNGATWYLLTAAGGSSIASLGSNQYRITVGDAIAFRYPNSMRLQIQNVTDLNPNPNTNAYNPINAADRTQPYTTAVHTAQDTTKPTAAITASSDLAQTITITFSETIDAAQIANPANYLVSKDEGATFMPLDGGLNFVTASSANTVATLTVPGLAFAGGTSRLVVRLSNMADLRGNPTSPATGYQIPTAAPGYVVATDTTPPTVSVTGALDASRSLTLTWSEPVTGGDTLGNFQFIKNAVNMGGFTTGTSISYNAANRTTTFILPAGSPQVFTGGDQVAVRVITLSTVKDLAGNTLSLPGNATAAFTVVDTTPPTATITTLEDKWNSLSDDAKIVITFSEPMKYTPLAAKANFSISRNGGAFTPLAAAGDSATPEGVSAPTYVTLRVTEGTLPLAGGDLVRIRMSNLRDNNNVATAPATDYEIGPFVAVDKTPPKGTVVAARDGDQSIQVVWDEPLAAYTTGRCLVNGVQSPAFVVGTNVTVSYDAPTRVLTFKLLPALGFTFTAGDSVVVRMASAQDASGNDANAVSGYYNTAAGVASDTTPPVAALASALDTQKFTVTFNEAVTGADTITKYWVSTNGGASYTRLTAASSVTYDAVAKAATVTIGAGDNVTLVNGGSLRVMLNDAPASLGIADALGNVMVNGAIAGPVTVVDGTKPTVSWVKVRGTSFLVKFSEPIDLASIDQLNLAANFEVQSPAGTPVSLAAGNFAYDAGTYTATISGLAFTYGATFRVKVFGARDLPPASNEMLNDNVANVFIGTVAGEVESWAGLYVTAGDANGGLGAGTLFRGPAGIGVGSAGSVYLLDRDGHRVRRYTGGLFSTFGTGVPGYVEGASSIARFNTPVGLAVRPGSDVYVYFADTANSVLRYVSNFGAGTPVTAHYAGNAGPGYADGATSVARFQNPAGLALDNGANYIYVADTGNHVIRRIAIGTNLVDTLAGSPGVAGALDGTGLAAQFNEPYDVAVDSTGTLYVAERGNHNIRKVTSAGVVTTLAGSGGAGFADGVGVSAAFNEPTGVAVGADGYLYVADSKNHRVRRVHRTSGDTQTVAGASAGNVDGAGAAAKFNTPFRLARRDDGTLLVTETAGQVVRIVRP